MSGHVNFATLAVIGLAVGVAGGLLAWLVRTPAGRGIGVTLLVAAVVVEGVAVLGRPADGDQSIAPPVSPPVIVTSPSGTPTPTGGSSSGVIPSTFHHQFLTVVHFHEDTSSGRSQRILNTQFVLLSNHGTQSVNLAGWTLSSASTGAVYTFPSITIAPNAEISLHTGTGTDTSDTLHWGRSSSAWSGVEDTATLKNPSGGLEDACHYIVHGDETSANC
jgi:hypothetical protein